MRSTTVHGGTPQMTEAGRRSTPSRPTQNPIFDSSLTYFAYFAWWYVWAHGEMPLTLSDPKPTSRGGVLFTIGPWRRAFPVSEAEQKQLHGRLRAYLLGIRPQSCLLRGWMPVLGVLW